MERTGKQKKKRRDNVRLQGAKRRFMRRWKLAAGCIDCGRSPTGPRQLHFDHIRGPKLFEPAHGTNSHGWKALVNELMKCVVRCASCHAKKTWRDRYARTIQLTAALGGEVVAP
jgi:hypothetical protein